MSTIRPSIVGALILGLVAGVIAGIAIGRARNSATPQVPRSKPPQMEPPRSVLPSNESRTEIPDDLAALKEIVVQQRAELGTLRARVLESEMFRDKILRHKLACAKDIYQYLVDARKSGDIIPDLKALLRADQLDENVAPFFVGEYRRSEGVARRVALDLALVCGGRETGELIKKLLGNAEGSEQERATLFDFLCEAWDTVLSPKPIPMDGDLVQMAFQLSGSPKPEERRNGAVLLGYREEPASRATLELLADGDSDPEVRVRAIQSLGRVGDRATLAYLRSYSNRTDSEFWLTGNPLSRAIDALEKRFPD